MVRRFRLLLQSHKSKANNIVDLFTIRFAAFSYLIYIIISYLQLIYSPLVSLT